MVFNLKFTFIIGKGGYIGSNSYDFKTKILSSFCIFSWENNDTTQVFIFFPICFQLEFVSTYEVLQFLVNLIRYGCIGSELEFGKAWYVVLDVNVKGCSRTRV